MTHDRRIARLDSDSENWAGDGTGDAASFDERRWVSLRSTLSYRRRGQTCGIFATLGKYFSPVTLLGGFSVPLSRIYNTTGAGA